MAGNLMFRITVDDKGNVALQKLGANTKKLKPQVASLGEIMKKTFAVVGTYKGIQYLNNQLRASIQNAVQFEKSLKNIEGITGKSKQAVGKLADEALRLSSVTEHSAVNISKAILAITKMGFDTEKTLQALPHILDLATASGEDLNWVATNSINIMKAFHMSASEMERIANVVATALNQTSLNLEDYMEAMKFVAPIAAATNVSLEETSAVLGILSDQSIRGSLGGTQVKNMLLNLLKVTPTTAAALKNMNMENASLTDILKQLHKAGVPVGEILKQFNKRAVAGAIAVGANADAVKKLQEALTNQARTAKEVSSIMRKSISSLGAQIGNVLSSTIIEISRIFEDDLRESMLTFLENLRNMYKWVEENDTEIRGFFIGLTTDIRDLTQGVIVLAKTLKPAISVLVGDLSDLETVGRNISNIFKAIILIKIIPYFTTLSTSIAIAGTKAGIAAGTMRGLAGSMNIVAAAAMAAYYAIDLLTQAENKRSEKRQSFMDDPARIKQVLDYLKEIKKQESDIGKNIQVNPVGYAGITSVPIDKAKENIKDLKKQIESVSGMKLGQADANTVLNKDMLTKRYTFLIAEQKKQKEKEEELKKLQKEKEEKLKKLQKELTDALNKQFGSLLGNPDGKSSAKDELKSFWSEVYEVAHEEEKRFWKRKATAYKIAWSFIYDEAEQATDLYDEHIDRIKQQQEEYEKSREAAISSMIESTKTMYNSMFDIQEQFNNKHLDNALDRIEEEEKAIERRYRIENAMAEGNVFRKTIAEQRYTNRKIQLEKKIQKEKERAARRERNINVFRASLDLAAGTLAVARDTQGGFWARLAASAAYAATFGVFLAKMTSLNLRHGTKTRMITGNGGEGTDMVNSNLTPGEVVLSKDDVRSLGGSNMLQQKIDTGSFQNGKTVNVYVDTFIGTSKFVRDSVIPIIARESTR